VTLLPWRNDPRHAAITAVTAAASLAFFILLWIRRGIVTARRCDRSIEAVDGRICAFSGSQQRRQKSKAASSKAADADPARVLAQCRRTMAASHEFSGDINGLGGP
jgi:hypothetical protein